MNTPATKLFLLSSFLLGASLSQGAIIAYENFDGLNLGSIHGQGLDTGGYNGSTWSIDGGGSGSDYDVTNTSPIATGNYLVGDTSSGSFQRGKRNFDNRGTSGDFAAFMSSSNDFDNDIDIDQGVLYLGFVTQFASGAADNSVFGVDNGRFANNAGVDSFAGIGKFNSLSSSNYSFIYDGTVGNGSSNSAVDTGISLGGNPVQWVLKLDMDADIVTVWADPANELADPVATVEYDTNGLFFQGFRLYRNLVVDEAVVATAFTDIVVIPEPSTVALILGLGALAFVGYRRRW